MPKRQSSSTAACGKASCSSHCMTFCNDITFAGFSGSPRKRSSSSLARYCLGRSISFFSVGVFVRSLRSTRREHGQLARLPQRATRIALHLAARGHWHRAGLHEHDGAELQLMLDGDRRAHRADRLRQRLLVVTTIDFVHQHEHLITFAFDGERGAAARVQQRMALRRGEYDVVRNMVVTADDDEFLEATRDEQLAVLDEAEVAAAHIRTFAAGEARIEGVRRFLGPVPIAVRDTRARDPYLADVCRWVGCAGIGIDDHDMLARGRTPRTHEPLPTQSAIRLDCATLCQRGAVEHRRHGCEFRCTVGYEEAGLGEPVTGIKGLAAKPARREVVAEPLQGVRAYRLGAVEGDAP